MPRLSRQHVIDTKIIIIPAKLPFCVIPRLMKAYTPLTASTPANKGDATAPPKES